MLPASPMHTSGPKVQSMEPRVRVSEERTAIKEDVAEECSKFGRVEAIKVPVSDNVSCKVFVRFDTIEAARAAMAALDGRMFDGRQISVGSLSLADFDALADGA